MRTVDTLEVAFGGRGAPHRIESDAQHGFVFTRRGEIYDAPGAQLNWQRGFKLFGAGFSPRARDNAGDTRSLAWRPATVPLTQQHP